MRLNVSDRTRGYTIVELMVTVVIVAFLAATIGIFIVRLLTVQEKDREEAYIREKLADICAEYANLLSVGSSISTNRFETAVKYRKDAGGVSFETGRVSRVVHLITSVTNDVLVSNVDLAAADGGLIQNVLSKIGGDGWLMSVPASGLRFSIRPIVADGFSHWDSEPGFENFVTTDAALCYLQVSARYEHEDFDGTREMKTVTAERVVRLWNHK